MWLRIKDELDKKCFKVETLDLKTIKFCVICQKMNK